MKVSDQDSQLLSRQFTATMERVESAADELPDDWQDAQIVERYSLGTKENRTPLRCSLPGKHRHGRGYLVRSPSDIMFRVGKDCGAREFGETWSAIERQFSAEESRQGYLKSLIALRPKLEKALAHIRSQETRSSIQYVTSMTEDFLVAFEPIASNLIHRRMPHDVQIEDEKRMAEKRANHQKRLDRVEELFIDGKIVVSDRDARLNQIRSSWDDRTIFRTVQQNFCPSSFSCSVLKSYKNLREMLDEAETGLAVAYKNLNQADTERMANSDLKKLRDSIRTGGKKWVAAAGLTTNFNRFFELANLRLIELWSKQKGTDFSFEVAEGRLSYHDHIYETQWAIPKPVDLGTEPIERICS